MNNRFDRRSRSLWMDVDVAPNACELEGDQSADTVIIGSGIAGISTAYELAIEGQKVIVLDRGPIAGGITARTSAHLAPLCDDLTSEMIRLRGEDVSQAFYVSPPAISAGSMAICSRRSTPIPKSSTTSWTPSGGSQPPSTVWSASKRWRDAVSSTRCAIRGSKQLLRSRPRRLTAKYEHLKNTPAAVQPSKIEAAGGVNARDQGQQGRLAESCIKRLQLINDLPPLMQPLHHMMWGEGGADWMTSNKHLR